MSHADNTVLAEQELGWVNECARRLRTIQADAAAAAPEKRREYLQEEIARSLKAAAPASRKRYLTALLTRFPVAGQVLSQTPTPQPATPSVQAVETPEEMLNKFIGAAAKLPEDERAEFSKRLSEAGFAWVDRDALVLEVSEESQKALGLPAGQQPNLTRMVELAAVLVEVFSRLDQTAIVTMRELSPRTPLIKRPEEFRSAVARFLAGQGDSLEPQMRAMASLLGGLLAGILGGGKDFGRQYVERFSPSAIEDVVIGEGGGGLLGPNKKERCWNKYTDLARDFATADLVERRIKDCLATFVEKKVLGR